MAFLCEEETGREVVVKALLELSDGNAVIKEAGALQKINSPYVIKIEEYGYVDGRNRIGPYLSMKYFKGKDLDCWIQTKGVFLGARGLEMARSIAQGMKVAHEKKIYHRDLKPANILYQEEGEKFALKIIDFGLALRGQDLVDQQRSLSLKSDRSMLEQEIVGTWKYAPPEQKGELDCRVGSYSDVYSYGMTLKMIFFGHFQPSKRILQEYSNQKLVNFLEDCTEYNPENRLGSFDEVLEALEGIMDGKVVKKVQQLQKLQKSLEQKSEVILSAGKAPKPKHPEFEGFRYLRSASYSCGGQSHQMQEYQHKATGLEFALIPSGNYYVKGYSNRKSKTVQLSPYLISKTQVTQKAWQKMMGNNPSYFNGDDRPVETVSWEDCQKFCQKAGLFLPTEVQWEVACRAGTKSEFYWGDSDSKLGEYAWWDKNSDSKTHPVGQKKPNTFGLYDMSGNVSEWCEDWYHGDKYPSSTSNPVGASSGLNRVNRGGGYCNSLSIFLVSGYRFYNSLRYSFDNVGLRVVCQ